MSKNTLVLVLQEQTKESGERYAVKRKKQRTYHANPHFASWRSRFMKVGITVRNRRCLPLHQVVHSRQELCEQVACRDRSHGR